MRFHVELPDFGDEQIQDMPVFEFVSCFVHVTVNCKRLSFGYAVADSENEDYGVPKAKNTTFIDSFSLCPKKQLTFMQNTY